MMTQTDSRKTSKRLAPLAIMVLIFCTGCSNVPISPEWTITDVHPEGVFECSNLKGYGIYFFDVPDTDISYVYQPFPHYGESGPTRILKQGNICAVFAVTVTRISTKPLAHPTWENLALSITKTARGGPKNHLRSFVYFRPLTEEQTTVVFPRVAVAIAFGGTFYDWFRKNDVTVHFGQWPGSFIGPVGSQLTPVNSVAPLDCTFSGKDFTIQC